MPAPVTPDEFKATIPSPTAGACKSLLMAWIRLPWLVWRLVSWMFNSDGSLSKSFKEEVGVATGALAAPTGLSATDGTSSTKVTITWTPVLGATYYEVYRSEQNDSDTASVIATSLSHQYEDTTGTLGKTYYYWAVARNGTQTSEFSNGDAGYTLSGAPSGGGGTPGGGASDDQEWTGNSVWTVPPGVTSIEVECWGAGGGGGASYNPYGAPGSAYYGGGGGGSGEYRRVKQIAVTAGEELTLVIDQGGAGGGLSGASPTPGADGGATILKRGSTALVTAMGGKGGGQGSGFGGAGTAGAGGTGGSNSTGTPVSNTNGNNGTAGASAFPPTAGTGGAAIGTGGNAGGNGGAFSDGVSGSPGKIHIIWPGAA
ncbi:MAG TPA: fibronectin type III domain-containing protein [Methylomirabilota bacterium]|nr:fibronectin type III domain-containing protein [Methylomirabilota bacterium]